MGWWSTTIMGGDTPLDFKSEFYRVIKMDQFKDKGVRVKKAFEQAQTQFISGEIDKIMNSWGCGKPDESFYKDYKSIGFQVLSVLMMENGCELNPELKQMMLEWIPQDSWTQEDDERKKNVDDLLNKVNNYNNKVTTVKGEGLFEVLAKSLRPEN